MSPQLPPPQPLICERCGHDRAEHHMANVADGPFVGKYFLVCPTATFKAKGYDNDGMAWKDKR